MIKPWHREQMATILQTTLYDLIFLYENDCILIQVWLKCVPKIPVDDTPREVQIMGGTRIGENTLSELTTPVRLHSSLGYTTLGKKMILQIQCKGHGWGQGQGQVSYRT